MADPLLYQDCSLESSSRISPKISVLPEQDSNKSVLSEYTNNPLSYRDYSSFMEVPAKKYKTQNKRRNTSLMEEGTFLGHCQTELPSIVNSIPRTPSRLRSFALSELYTKHIPLNSRKRSRSTAQTRNTKVSKSSIKRNMMKIFEKYNLLPKIEKAELSEEDLISTDMLFKKMHVMLFPNKYNYIQYLKQTRDVNDPNFNKEMKLLNQKIEGEISLKQEQDKKKKINYVQQLRRMSEEMLARKFLSQRSKDINLQAQQKNDESGKDFGGPIRKRSPSVLLRKQKYSQMTQKSGTENSGSGSRRTSGAFKLHLLPLNGSPSSRVNKAPIPKHPHEEVFRDLVSKMFQKKKEEETENKDEKIAEENKKKINKIVNAVMNKEKDTMLLMMENTLEKSSGQSSDSRIVEYLRYCAEEKVIPIPIMTNIINGALCLENYKLGDGICRALGRFLPGLQGVNKLQLINNGLSDSNFADLLGGLCHSEKIKRLDCTGNMIGESSLLELGNILSRVGPEEQFEELTLNHCKISNLHLNQLLEIMGNNCPLQKLGIARLACDEITVDWLSKILKKANNLSFLDLSGCEMLAVHLLHLLRILARNRKLEYVNLSWLPLGSQGEMTMSSVKNEILIYLCMFIAKNKQLVHLDLSYSRITDIQIKEILTYASKSPSLMSLHLSGNAVSEKFKTEWLTGVEGQKLEFDRFHSEYETENLEKKDKKKKKTSKKLLADTKIVLWCPKGKTGEMAFSKCWIESSQCFICDGWQYTVFCFSQELANKKFISLSSPPRISRLRTALAAVKGNSPHLLLETYQYKPLEMKNLTEFFNKLDPESQANVSLRNIYALISSKAQFPPYFATKNEVIQFLPGQTPMYFAAVLLPPGKHDFYIIHPQVGTQLYFESVNIHAREAEVRAPPLPPHKKHFRLFIKSRSVFKAWREDTPGLLKKVLEYDFHKSKIKKIVKNSLEQKAVYEILDKYIGIIKEEFMSIIVHSGLVNK